MSTLDTHAENRTDPRPTTIVLGTDTEGAEHYYRTRAETIHVVEAGGTRSHTFDVSTRSVDAYMAFVAEECDGREWASRHYGVGFVEMLRNSGAFD